jgi:hypothetical protein
MLDQMCTTSLMRTLDKFQPTEERLPQSTTLSQENLDKESTLSQQVQALQPRKRHHSHKFKVTVKVMLKPRLHQLLQPQRKFLLCNHWNINIEQTQILQT